MANRLNVLVGAILDGNVAKDLNKELKSIEGKLEALSIRASFDGDFKAVVEAIQKAVSSIDLSILNNGLDSARNSLVNTSKEMQNLGRVTEKSNKVVTDLQGNLKTVERTVEGMDGKEVKVKFVADKDGGFDGDLTYTDTTGQKSISEARKAEQYWLSEKTKANEKSAKKEEAAWRKYYSFLVKSNTEANEKEIKNAEKARLAEEKRKEEIKNTKKAYKDLEKVFKATQQKYLDARMMNPNMDLSKEEKELMSIGGALNRYKQMMKEAGKETKWFTDLQKTMYSKLKSANTLGTNIDKETEKYQKQVQKQVEAEEKAQDKLYSQKLKLNSGVEEQKRQELAKTQDAYEKLDKTIEDLYKYSGNNKIFGQEQAKEIDRYEVGLKEVEDILKKENVQYSELIYAQKKLTSLQNSASSFTAELNKQVVAQDKLTQSTKKQIQALSAQHEIKATRLTSQYGDLFDEEEFSLIANHYLVAIERELKKIRPEANRIDETIQEWKRHVGQFETELRASHKQAKRIKDEIEILDSSLGRFIQFYGFGELFRATKTGITEMVSAVSTLDASLVELKKVSDETDATYDKFMDNAADRAKELGVAMSDYIDSVTNFARSGFDFSEAQEIAKTANIMQMVSEQMSADEASEYLISIIRGFNIEASKSIDIVNALNNVDRRSQSEMSGQTLSFYRRTSRNGRPIPRIRLFYVMCA